MRKVIIISVLLVLGLNGFGQVDNDSSPYLKIFNYKIPLNKNSFKYDEFGEEIQTIDSTKYYYFLSDVKKENIPFKHPVYTGQYDEFGDIMMAQFELKDSIQVDIFLGEISKNELLNILNGHFIIMDVYEKYYLTQDYDIEFSKDGEYIQISRAEKLWFVKLSYQINQLKKGDIVLINSLSYINPFRLNQELGKVYWKII